MRVGRFGVDFFRNVCMLLFFLFLMLYLAFLKAAKQNITKQHTQNDKKAKEKTITISPHLISSHKGHPTPLPPNIIPLPITPINFNNPSPLLPLLLPLLFSPPRLNNLPPHNILQPIQLMHHLIKNPISGAVLVLGLTA